MTGKRRKGPQEHGKVRVISKGRGEGEEIKERTKRG